MWVHVLLEFVLLYTHAYAYVLHAHLCRSCRLVVPYGLREALQRSWCKCWCYCMLSHTNQVDKISINVCMHYAIEIRGLCCSHDLIWTYKPCMHGMTGFNKEQQRVSDVKMSLRWFRFQSLAQQHWCPVADPGVYSTVCSISRVFVYQVLTNGDDIVSVLVWFIMWHNHFFLFVA